MDTQHTQRPVVLVRSKPRRFGRGSLGEEVGKAASRVELSIEQQGFIASLLQEMMVREPERRLSAHDALCHIESAESLFGAEVAEYSQLVEDMSDAPLLHHRRPQSTAAPSNETKPLHQN